jgi:hypothetical protein
MSVIGWTLLPHTDFSVDNVGGKCYLPICRLNLKKCLTDFDEICDMQCVTVMFPEVKTQSMKLTIHLHLLLWFWVYGALTLHPPVYPLCGGIITVLLPYQSAVNRVSSFTVVIVWREWSICRRGNLRAALY